MKINTIDASLCAKMFLAGAKNLESKKEWINELNVFPVPDGDTGTNMTLTIMSAAKEVAGMENITMETFAKAVSNTCLVFSPMPFNVSSDASNSIYFLSSLRSSLR